MHRLICLDISGFLEKEIKKDGIPMLDTGDNPDAPVPREMIDLEVGEQDVVKTDCSPIYWFVT